MTVIVPCDYNQTKLATMAIAEHHGPVYLRFGRPKVANFTSETEPFVIGKAQVLAEGKDVTIFACGHLVWKAIEAGKILTEKGHSVEIINIHTIKPLDEKAVIASATKTGCVVTAEEHNMIGGLGESISGTLSRSKPTPIEMVAVHDTFGESGKPEELMTKYHIDTPDIVEAALKVMGRK
jgi:transketolase